MRTGKIYHPEEKHPPEWQRDLNPAANAGVNRGEVDRHPERAPLRTAYDVKEAHAVLRDAFTDDELKQLPVLAAGTRLEEGAVYVDLRDPARAEVTGRGDMAVGEGQLVVPKAEVGYQLWNRLTNKPEERRAGG
jgi:hypothetical protein